MSVNYKGLIRGNMDVLAIARAIARYYGGDNFKIRFSSDSIVDYGYGLGAGIDRSHMILEFDQELGEDVKVLRPWERKAHRIHRTAHIFSDGDCASDYKEITQGPMTYVSLGHWGECREIIDALVAHFGGFVNDEAGSQEWEVLTPDAYDAAIARTRARRMALEILEANHKAKAKNA